MPPQGVLATEVSENGDGASGSLKSESPVNDPAYGLVPISQPRLLLEHSMLPLIASEVLGLK